MVTKVSIIGCGNQGTAFVRGLSRAETDWHVIACDRNEDKAKRLGGYADVTTTETDDAEEADIVVLAVKPGDIPDALDGLSLGEDQTLVSVGAAVPVEFLSQNTQATVVRVMPNLAAEYREMAATATRGSGRGDPDGVPREVRRILDDLGNFVEVDESHMDISTAINGSGPAFVFYLMRAVRESGIDSGLGNDEAETLVAQTFKSAAEIVERDDRTLDELIDAVCSPGGTTIEGMEVLRDSDTHETIIEAIYAAEERSEEISDRFGPEEVNG